MNLTKEELEKYKRHPRVLEVRFITLFDVFEREYGYQFTLNLFKCICDAFTCNFKFLLPIINKRFDIKKRQKVNFRRWRQDVIFASTVYGDSLYKVAHAYLATSPSNLYVQSDIYDINKFCTDEWLSKLDKDVAISGETTYAIEIIRFLEIIENLYTVLAKWRG